MKALILTPFPQELAPAILKSGMDYAAVTEKLINPEGFDWLISFGYRHILKLDILDRFPNRAINLHISWLPWNRGADPNFWSWFDGTPKGVTIHQMDKGVDTGPILAQQACFPFGGRGHDLRSSYWVLIREMAALFATNWPDILAGKLEPKPQSGIGSTHKAIDKTNLLEQAKWIRDRGWDATCEEIERFGEECRAKAA